jgi:hypothetical protein
MTSDAFDRALASFAGQTPFRPFVIEMVSGQQVAVRHPEAVAMWDELIVFRGMRGEFQLFDPSSVCRLFDIEKSAEVPS